MENKEKIKEIAKQIFLDLSDEEYVFFSKEFGIFLKQLEFFEKDSDIDNFKPSDYPFLVYNSFLHLRKDVPNGVEKTEDILKNVPDKLGIQIKIPKVIDE